MVVPLLRLASECTTALRRHERTSERAEVLVECQRAIETRSSAPNIDTALRLLITIQLDKR